MIMVLSLSIFFTAWCVHDICASDMGGKKRPLISHRSPRKSKVHFYDFDHYDESSVEHGLKRSMPVLKYNDLLTVPRPGDISPYIPSSPAKEKVQQQKTDAQTEAKRVLFKDDSMALRDSNGERFDPREYKRGLKKWGIPLDESDSESEESSKQEGCSAIIPGSKEDAERALYAIKKAAQRRSKKDPMFRSTAQSWEGVVVDWKQLSWESFKRVHDMSDYADVVAACDAAQQRMNFAAQVAKQFKKSNQ